MFENESPKFLVSLRVNTPTVPRGLSTDVHCGELFRDSQSVKIKGVCDSENAHQGSWQ